ncbi:PAX-interacting protein 1-like isoform X2 [Palaemon carinicauda]|uniref:PAX-interacting protein 1-like isoform X1 n=1 Tax=Palaemon carinicauda TaxID=392227 RepID=UPI0035B5ECE3
MATGESVEGDTLIAKAGGNGKSRRGKLTCQKSNSPSAGKGDRPDGGGVKSPVGKSGGGGAAVGGSGGSEVAGTTSKIKRPQYCTICKNHNQQVLKKRHKCPYSDCQCPLCQLSRRVQCIMCHQQRLWRFRKSMEKNGGSSQGGSEVSTTPNSSNGSPSSSSSNSSTGSTFASERDCQLQESAVDDPLGGAELTNGKEGLKCERPGKQQVCDKCRNHDIWVLKRGHKGKCPYENCTCQYCSFTIKRRDLMKHQQRVRRAQVTTVSTTGPKDYLLQPVENSAAATTSNSPSPEEESVSSPDGNSGINDKEPHHDNPNPSVEGQVPWPNCSNDKPVDFRVSPKLSHQPSRMSPPSQHSDGDPTSYQSSNDPSLVQHQQMDSMPLQQANIDTRPYQQASPNTTPFQQNKDIAIAYQQQRRDSITFNTQNRDSVSLQHSAADHMSFQQPIRESAPFHQPSRHTSQFEHPIEESSSFQQLNGECMPHRQQNRDTKNFQQLNGESVPFQMSNRESTSFQQPRRESTPFQQPRRESTPFQQPSRDSTPFQQPSRDSTPFQQPSRDPTPFQQPIRNIATYQQTNRSMSFQQSIRESTAFHQQNRETGIAFQQPNREPVPFQKQRRDLTSLQESNKESVLFPHPQRDTGTPFQHQDRNSTPFQQPIPANPASPYTHMVSDDVVQSPLKRMKIEPNFEHDAVYDCSGIQNHLENYQILDTNGNLTPPREFLPSSHDITSMRNYNNIPRSHLQPKFGVHPEDLLLRHWPTSDMEDDNNQSQNGRNIREASVCSPLSHSPQQLNLSQNQMQITSQIQPQPPHQHLIGGRAEVDFKPHVSIVGSWGSSNVSMSTLSAPRIPINIAQTPCSAMHLTACEEFASSSAVPSQGAWWHQVRMAGLERTNSC